MKVQPIRTEDDYHAALRKIDKMGSVEPGTKAFDLQDVLITLVEPYEARQYPIGPPSPIDAIEFALDRKGLTRRDLVPCIGSRSQVEAVLARRVPLTLSMIQRLSKFLDVSLATFAQPYPLKAGSSRAGLRPKPFGVARKGRTTPKVGKHP